MLAPAAGAAIVPASHDPAGAGALAGAMAGSGTAVTGASFNEVPPLGDPNAVAGTPLGGFPTDPASYAILSSGDAKKADPATPSGGDSDGGPVSHGQSAQDVTVLRVDLDVPPQANCLVLSLRFLTDEAPQAPFNDGFIAELDVSDWSTDDTSPNRPIVAPHNFAFDPQGRVISVHSEGETSLSQEQAAGTGYASATQLLSAAQGVSPGAHTLHLSIFDQGDDIVDSAVFVDGLGLFNVAPGACVAGAQTSPPAPAAPPPAPPPPPAPLQHPILGQTVETLVPVQGKTVRVGVVSGRIRIRRRASSSFEELDGIELLPVGSTVDATKGRMQLTTATGVARATQTADFYQGEFQVLQSKNSATTELKLAGASLASCSSKRARSSAKRKPVRRLFGDGKGSFRTLGRHAAATVRGTKWLTQDTCKGTLVRVSRGTVKVRDLTRKRTVTVRRGHSYLARPPR
ncbi:MAG TPA: choice-of-anchor L domain-containing protein [Solirubrobacteraceae bacterium]|nr:choice-of-anchor L domain-containing protein [Solirubrobacteraceae bacterium]